MKAKMIVILFAGLFSLASCEKDALRLDSEEEIYEKSGEIPTEGKLESFQFNSRALVENMLGDPAERKVNVYLPKSYYARPWSRFPVIYFLHGIPVGENSLIDPISFEIFRQVANLQPVDFPEEGFLAWVNNLIKNEGMKEVIIVMPDAHTLFGPPAYTNSPVQGNYENYIVKDLIRYVDSHFRTIAHFNNRAVAGQCAGGYGALKLAMKNPDIFRNVAALSPAHFPDQTVEAIAGFMLYEDKVWLNDYGVSVGPIPYSPMQPFKFANNSLYSLAQAWLPNPENQPYYADIPFSYIDGQLVLIPELMKKWNAHSLFSLAMKNQNNLKKMKTIYFDCGQMDELGMYQPNVVFHEMLTQMRIKHQFEEYEGGHISKLYERLGPVFIQLSNDISKNDNGYFPYRNSHFRGFRK